MDGQDLFRCLDCEVASSVKAVHLDHSLLRWVLSDTYSNQLVVAVHPHKNSVSQGEVLLNEVRGNDAFETFDTAKTDSLPDKVHIRLMVPATDDH